jgi:glycosyltransferase involved in cell wall biosynthesis
MSVSLSVLVPTRNPDPGRLARTLEGLATQTLNQSVWELIIIDNGSAPSLATYHFTSPGLRLPRVRIVHEARPGLTLARLRGIAEARGEVIVFVDDDNVLTPSYLSAALAAFEACPRLAAAGGPVRPEFAMPPPEWLPEFFGLLALHDYGPTPLLATGDRFAPWPAFAPVGGGLCIRRSAALAYAEAVRLDPARATLDRRDGELSSGGDNDIVFTALRAGGDVSYNPELTLTHLIPAARLSSTYLARLNRGIQRSWVRVLAVHDVCPWPAISRETFPLRAIRAWFREYAWAGPAQHIRFQGILGRFEGQADLSPR